MATKTMESEELSSSPNENVQTRKNSSTMTINEEQNMQRKERRYSQNYPVTCTYSDLKKWRIFDMLHKKFASQIHMIMPFDNDSALIITKDKKVYGLGTNNDGQLGLNEESCIQPAKVKTLCGKNIKTFYCCFYSDNNFALTEEGEVYFWGSNRYLRLGSDLQIERYTPAKINSLSEKYIIDVASNYYNSVALTDDGKLCIWEITDFESLEPHSVKFELEEEKIVQIACGKSYSVALSDSGKLYSWGLNHNGQLGLNSEDHRSCASLISSLTDVKIVKVVCGTDHSLALTTEGRIYSWGNNDKGQLGHGEKTKLENKPVMLDGSVMGRMSDIAARDKTSVAINKIGCVYVWGFHVNRIIWKPFKTEYSNIHDIFRDKITYIIDDSIKDKSNISEAFDDMSTSDFIIQVEKQSIHVHKAILKIRCQYFRNMFQNDKAERVQSIIENKKFSYNVYKTFLKYLYTDVIDHLSFEEALELLKLCHKYNEAELEKKCIQMIRENIAVSNVLLTYAKAIEYNAKDLEEFCFEYAFCHMTDVIKSDAFAKLNEVQILINFIIKVAKAGIFKT